MPAEGEALLKFQAPADTPGRERFESLIAGMAMDIATAVNSPKDFLDQEKIAAPVPFVPGAFPNYASVLFEHETGILASVKKLLGKLSLAVPFPADMSVNWTIGDRSGMNRSSLYWDPDSPWYNVFYGAYGVKSHKANKYPWGFGDPDGRVPDPDEMLRIPEFDYNYLTAGQLGCPKNKQRFEVTHQKLRDPLPNGWFQLDIECRIPSGLHTGLITEESMDFMDPKHPAAGKSGLKIRPAKEVLQELLEKVTLMYYGYMLIMGLPPAAYRAKIKEDYELVDMTGTMYFKRMKPDITLAWGALCPRKNGGPALAKQILDVMAPQYGVKRS